MPRTKSGRVRIKAAGTADGLQSGQFRALVSVFGNEDSMGDVIEPGAFAQVLAEWKASGDPIPVVWAHQWTNIRAYIGRVLEATETAEGLEVLAQIEHMDTNPDAAHVHALLTDRLITQFSFAYEVAEGGWVETDDLAAHPWGEYYSIKRFGALFEVGPCLIGANRETDLLDAAKSGIVSAARDLLRGVKEGRVLAQQHFDRLQGAHAAIGEVLSAAEPQKTTPAPVAKTRTGVPPAAPTPAQVAAWATTVSLTTRSA
ncbi:hypothetical protein GCM10009639_53880 [Kitasatospora putterlickiae]|uniref:Prohead serine protease domain-containing protein n=1 Tax=Kitasatospora putterlickiae TaxID=221725 RepID=A0ABN1YF98_9ACTN